MIFLSRSSNSPRYLVPATSEADVQRQHPLVDQRLGHVAATIRWASALGDGGLADAGLADQGRVVLGPAAKDLDDALDLLLAADDRVELVRPRQLGQVDAQLVQGRRLGRALRLLCRRTLVLWLRTWITWWRTLSRFTPRLSSTPAAMPSPSRDQAQQQVLGTDVVVAQPSRLVDGQLDHALGARRQADLADDTGRSPRPMMNSTAVRTLDSSTFMFSSTRAATPSPSRTSPGRQVLGADVVMVEALGLVLRQGEDLSRSVCELVESVHVATWLRLPRRLGDGVPSAECTAPLTVGAFNGYSRCRRPPGRHTAFGFHARVRSQEAGGPFRVPPLRS